MSKDIIEKSESAEINIKPDLVRDLRTDDIPEDFGLAKSRVLDTPEVIKPFIDQVLPNEPPEVIPMVFIFLGEGTEIRSQVFSNQMRNSLLVRGASFLMGIESGKSFSAVFIAPLNFNDGKYLE